MTTMHATCEPLPTRCLGEGGPICTCVWDLMVVPNCVSCMRERFWWASNARLDAESFGAELYRIEPRTLYIQ